MKKDSGLARHDSLVDLVNKHLVFRGYNVIYKNTEYSVKSCGEIDLWAKRDGYVLLFEMKSMHSYRNRKKAISQLDRAETNFCLILSMIAIHSCFSYCIFFKYSA